jgi:hypothetical protein
MRAFCLTLPELPKMMERAAAHFAERGIDGVEMVYGVNAALCGLATTNTYEKDNPGSGFRIGTKLTGIWLGWQIVWSICNALPDSHFLLFEHDAVLVPDFRERMAQALRDVPADFDWLFLAHCCAKGHPTRHVAGEVFEVKYPQCNHATVIAKKALPHILATQRRMYGPQDCTLIFDTFPALKVYTVLPRMAEQLNTDLAP